MTISIRTIRRVALPAVAVLVVCAGAFVTDASAQGVPPVVEAARAADLERLRELVEASAADPDAAEVDGTTALHWAVRRDDEDMVRLLLDLGADADLANRYGITPLQVAAVNGNAATVGALLDAGADANAVLPEGETVLMSAARTGVAEVVALLLDHGADPEAREDWYGENALMWAAAEDHPDVARILVAGGADVDVRSALQDFERRRSGQSVLSLGSWTPLMYAARENALGAGAALVEAGAGLDLVDPDGATALVIAIINGHYEFALMLIEAGADPNIADNDAGMGPLYAAIDMHRLAVGHGRPNPVPVGLATAVDVVRELLEAGADPNVRLTGPTMQRHHTAGDASLGEGATPLLRASKSGDVAIMELLVAAGADPTLAMPNGSNALMYAAGLGWRNGSPAAPSFDQGTDEEAVAAIRLLLGLGLDINVANESGDTPMHAAIAGRASETIIRFLVSRGAALDLENGRGQTPLAIAEGRGLDSIAEVLREADGESRP
jgi:uncharacterized protein